MDPILVLIVVLIILWAAGFSLSIGGSLIHLLIVIILVCVIYRLLTNRKVL